MKKHSWLAAVALAGFIGCTESAAPEAPDTAAPDAGDVTTNQQVDEAPADETPAEPVADGKLNAETVLASAMDSAAKDNKRVLVHLGAPW